MTSTGHTFTACQNPVLYTLFYSTPQILDCLSTSLSSYSRQPGDRFASHHASDIFQIGGKGLISSQILPYPNTIQPQPSTLLREKQPPPPLRLVPWCQISWPSGHGVISDLRVLPTSLSHRSSFRFSRRAVVSLPIANLLISLFSRCSCN